MRSQDILKSTQGITNMVLNSYLGDMSDGDLLKRPGADCNHIAWQLGHLIASNTDILNLVSPGAAPELPAGFADKHSKETDRIEDPSQFYTKDEYLGMMKQFDQALTTAIDKSTEADLDQPSPERFRAWCPKVGDVFVLLVTHSLMHAGQWVPVRRILGKPIVI